MHVASIAASKVFVHVSACLCGSADNDFVRGNLARRDMEAFCGRVSSSAVGKHIDSKKLIARPDVTPC